MRLVQVWARVRLCDMALLDYDPPIAPSVDPTWWLLFGSTGMICRQHLLRSDGDRVAEQVCFLRSQFNSIY